MATARDMREDASELEPASRMGKRLLVQIPTWPAMTACNPSRQDELRGITEACHVEGVVRSVQAVPKAGKKKVAA